MLQHRPLPELPVGEAWAALAPMLDDLLAVST
jgi:hypothetical protein